VVFLPLMLAGILGACCEPARALVPHMRRYAKEAVIVDVLMMYSSDVSVEVRLMRSGLQQAGRRLYL
jgi:hypothetical protein